MIAIIDGFKGFPQAINSVFSRDADSDLHRASKQKRRWRGNRKQCTCFSKCAPDTE